MISIDQSLSSLTVDRRMERERERERKRETWFEKEGKKEGKGFAEGIEEDIGRRRPVCLVIGYEIGQNDDRSSLITVSPSMTDS